MSSVREQALAALFDRLKANLLGTIRRATGDGGTVPLAGAMVTQEDGSLDAEALISPLCYAISHTVPITIQARMAGRADVDTALQGIAGILAADPTLGGAVEWAEISGMDAGTDAPSENGQPMPREQTAQITIVLTYTAPTPVG